jgi:serine/threonine protein kinase
MPACPPSQSIIQQLLRAIEVCHGHNILHRDVKPQNILLSDNGNVVVCVLGGCRLGVVAQCGQELVVTVVVCGVWCVVCGV